MSHEKKDTGNKNPNQVKFSYEGSTVNVFKFNENTSSDVLHPQVYSLQRSMFGYFLTIKTNKFEIPEKIYGSMEKRVDKVMHTYETRRSNTGVLFTGHKGSGKTMLTNIICNRAIEQLNLPVILIEFAAAGPGFIDFIESLGECVLLFDEFGKMYNNSDNNQDDLLSLLDGTAMHKRLVMMTENKEDDISSFLKGRPGRIFYHFKYGKLVADIISEVSQESGLDEKTTNEILDVSRSAQIFSFDILNAIIEEHKRYGTPVLELIEDLNIGLDDDVNVRMEIIKAVYLPTGEELEVPFANKYFNKPNRYNSASIYVKKPAEEFNKTMERMKDRFEEYVHGRWQFGIDEDDLKAEENDTCVYAMHDDKIIITAKYSPEDKNKFYAYI